MCLQVWIFVTFALTLNLRMRLFIPFIVHTFPIYAIVLIPENSALVRFRNCRARKHFVMSEIKMDVGGVDSAFDVQTPILENMVVGVPPVFEGLTKQLEKIVEQPLLGPKAKFPTG